MSGTNYPARYDELVAGMQTLGAAAPGAMGGFGQMHQATISEGALSPKTKELMALAIAVVVRCDGCIAFHVHDALGAGATDEEIHETLSVAVLMGGGPAVVYATEAMQALAEFHAAESSAAVG